ncbi:uncharacterized protein LOC143224723 isoform X2 [Tachypleus tridentatus]|uniref:uncharacterized protein LOC143224723 isoform X2 n=1 Tax=Tachypleus tridentatus TaxID=6853 RepID=UPI003FD54973
MDIQYAENEEPQKEPLHFNINYEGLSTDVSEVVHKIQQVAEKVLFHWRTFPIVLPPPLAVLTSGGDSLTRKPKPLNLRDLFLTPSFDEIEAVAVDIKGEPRRLNEKQLRSIRAEGEFEVESVNFPGQVHRWQLSQILQKGTQKVHLTLLRDIALSLRLLFVTAQNRLHSEFFSVSGSVHSLLQGLLLLTDAFFGVPSLSAKNLEIKVREERIKYLVAELTVKPSLEDDLDNLCQFVRHQIRKQTMEKYRIENEKPPTVPYIYQTPKDHEIDLRLFNKDIIRKVVPILASVLEKEARGWFLPFRERVIAELKTKKLSEEEIEKQANIAVLDEYTSRVFRTLLTHPDIQALGEGIGQLLIEQAQSVILMQCAVENVREKLNHRIYQLKRSLSVSHPILSLIQPWVQEKVRYAQREPVLKQELSRVRNPTRVYHWRTQIWCPQEWRVRRVFQGVAEVVQTAISRTSSSLAHPRSDPNQPVYLVEKQRTRTTTTRWPFWRWMNYFFRTWSWTWNAMFLFGVVVPWCSPVSLRALCSIKPFMPDLELNQCDGVLYPRKSSLTQTLCSRLVILWRHISKSRTEFESRPDTGFIGKGFGRHVNRMWNYVMKGGLGTLLIVLIFPCMCLLVSGMSLLIAVSAPIWMPLSTLVFHFAMVLFYDFDSPAPTRNKLFLLLEALVWRIVIQGLIQPVIALLIAALLCPVGTLLVLIVAMLRCCCRLIWDWIIFHLVIKKRGRVPALSSWLVRRVEGPGLSNNHYFKIRPEQALAAFEAKLEVEELGAFREEVERTIVQPQQAYSEFVQQCFRPFSASLAKDGMYSQLEKEAQDILYVLRDQVDKRRKELQMGLSSSTRAKVRLLAHDLQLAIRQATLLLEKFYPTHVFKRLLISEEDFWENRGLQYRDWPGLASQMFCDIFSIDILTPLEDSDVWFRLETHNANLTRYTEMLQQAEQRIDIDVTNNIHTPKGNIQVPAPYLDIVIFNPIRTIMNTTHKSSKQRKSLRQWKYPWKHPRKEFRPEKLLIPLPISHPAQIAVIIFNRENEDPIALESEACQCILKAIEEGTRGSALGNHQVSESTPPDERSLAIGDDYRPTTPSPESVTADSEDHLSRDSRASYSQSQRTSGSIIVNLASSEDITLEPDGQRVTYSHSSYSTTV